MSDITVIELGETGMAAAVKERRAAGEGYPKARALAGYVEAWMLYALPLVLAAAAGARVFFQFHWAWLLFAPAVALCAFVALRAGRNSARVRLRAREHGERAQRAARYAALVKPAREAVDGLRREIGEIRELSALRGDQFEQLLSRLSEWGNDYVDLLYLYQVRSRRLQSIRGRNIEGARLEVAAERERAGENRRLAGALDQHDQLLVRQAGVAAELETSLALIKQQARNIEAMVRLVADQASSLPLGVEWTSSSSDFQELSDAIRMTKEDIEAVGDHF